MKTFQILLQGIGGVLFLWFLLPLFSHRIFNIGNATGLLVSAALFALGRWQEFWVQRIVQWGRFSGGRLLLGAFAVCLILGVGIVLLESVLVFGAAVRKPKANAPLLVLGCRVYGERASRSLRERLDAAVVYLEENPNSVCIVSGGKGAGETISEAECMYRYLIKKGIDADRLRKEDRSTSTRENLLFSKEILEAEGLGTEIAIATSEYHEYRAGRVARSLGFSVGAVSGHTAWWLFPTFFVRELYGIAYEVVAH